MISFVCGFFVGVAFTVIVIALLFRDPPNFLPW